MKNQIQESLVLIENETSKLRYSNIADFFTLYQLDSDGNFVKKYIENVDYILNRKEGLIQRTRQSFIPDYASHPFYHKGKFNLEDHGGNYTNNDFIVFADYAFNGDELTTEDHAIKIAENNQSRGSLAHLLNERKMDILVFGDSISCGYESRDPKYAYFNRLADYLHDEYHIEATVMNYSINGYDSRNIQNDFNRKVKGKTFDLVLIAFGMNDQNTYDGQANVGLEEYEKNIHYFLDNIHIRLSPVLISYCRPNPLWKISNPHPENYPKVLAKIARERNIPFSDTFSLWESELKAGKKEIDLLNNNVNHPTIYGHYLYFTMLKTLFEK